MSERFEDRVVISGLGQSDVGRRTGRDPLALTVDACLAAIKDAGLERDDIDGLSTYPGIAVPGAPGFSGASAVEVQEALRLRLNWFTGGIEMPGQLGSIVNAAMAVATGLCRHVLCFRTVWESTAQRGGPRKGIGVGESGQYRATSGQQWTLPFGAASAANWIALMAQRHFHEFGTTREQLAWVALNGRRHAALNPAAIYRDELTMDDYMSARMISTPFCLYDCDVPVDASTAIIVSSVDTVADLPHSVPVEAVGTAIHDRPSWDQWSDLTTMAARDAARQMWARTYLKPADVDVAELYDGFSFITLAWLEALGFCDKGQAGPFIEGGQRIALGGELPLNTHGGQLSAGRLHGYGFLYEACLQLRGQCGRRQVDSPELAVASAGGGPLAASILLRKN